MKLRLALASAVLAAVPLSLLALPALATTHDPAGPPPPKIVSLHSAFERARPHIRLGRIAGVVPPVGKRVKPSPGGQSSTIGTRVSLEIHASSSAGAAVSFRASGLPAGLSISASGLISGTPSVTAATYRTTVTATDSKGVAGSRSFPWSVRSGAGPVRGYGSKCADDYRGRTANGNRIDIWTCNANSRQKLTFLANGEVTVLGRCLRDIGARVVLYACNGAGTEQSTRHSSGEYVIRYNGQCLTAPSAANGTQLVLAWCNDSKHQRWSLP